jgi:CspA family cold shock protein
MTSTNVSRSVGRVKWFNNKAGYGFVTCDEKDIFVHHSAIQVDNQQYKYLVQGEYVHFDLIKTTSSDHELQASDVTGINRGKLMCETRLEFKTSQKDREQEPRPDQRQDTRTEREPRPERTERPKQQPPPQDSQPQDSQPWTLAKPVTSQKPTRGRPSKKVI